MVIKWMANITVTVPPSDSPLSWGLLNGLGGHAAETSSVQDLVSRLFEELQVPLSRYLLSFGLTLHDVEEVVQEVFLSLFLHVKHGKRQDNLRGWIFKVGHNLALKRRNRDAARSCEDGADAERHWDPGPNPEEQCAARQRQGKLQAVVRALPEVDRSCLYLRAEGLRYREIAEVLGISLGAVSLSLERSLARLSCVRGT